MGTDPWLIISLNGIFAIWLQDFCSCLVSIPGWSKPGGHCSLDVEWQVLSPERCPSLSSHVKDPLPSCRLYWFLHSTHGSFWAVLVSLPHVTLFSFCTHPFKLPLFALEIGIFLSLDPQTQWEICLPTVLFTHLIRSLYDVMTVKPILMCWLSD